MTFLHQKGRGNPFIWVANAPIGLYFDGVHSLPTPDFQNKLLRQKMHFHGLFLGKGIPVIGH